MVGEGNGDTNGPETEKVFLNPLDKAKLAHLLARLPTTLGKLRKGDIARVTTFAITHASRGADEVVEMIVANVLKPLSLTSANPEKRQEPKLKDAATGADESLTNESLDTSSASLVALYVVNDVLSSSSASGVRHAWRFRQLFETALREHKVFEWLGSMAEKLGWGRLRAEKWKRSISLILNLWEGWCVFPAESHDLFVQTFESPPSLSSLPKTDEQQQQQQQQQQQETAAQNGSSKWKSVEALPASKEEPGASRAAIGSANLVCVDEEALMDGDVMGEPMDEEDVEGEPIDDDDVAGEPVDDDELQGEPMDEAVALGDENQSRDDDEDEDDREDVGSQESAGRTKQRKRMRAVDMFADSDVSEKDGHP